MRNKGFIKTLVVITVGLCILFIIAIQFARYVPGLNQTGTGGLFDSLGGSSSGYSTDYSNHTNPLLDFGDSGADFGSYGGGSGGTRWTPNTDGVGTSPYSGAVRLGLGNASYSIQPFEEYVTIQNSGSPVSITGWRLSNGKGSRPIQTSGNSYVYPTADSATIGQGTQFLSPDARYALGSIVLAKGDTAIVTTGAPFAQYSMPITTSFRENICLGYLKYYPFAPAVQLSCPYASADPQSRTVTDECYDYIRGLSRCEDPERDDKKRFDEQGSLCQNFVKERLTYGNCVANNKNGAGFSTDQWRVFLGKTKEMWADDRETVTLYDANGLIVDQISY